MADFELHCCNQELTPYQADMIQACKDGKVSLLEEKLQQNSTKNSNQDSCYADLPTNGNTCCIAMMTAAIEQDQVEVVKLLLSFYQHFSVTNPEILGAIVRNQNLEIAEILYQHDNYFADNMPLILETFLSLVCRMGPRLVPLVHFLLDHGANVKYGGFSDIRGGAIAPAIKTGFPLAILEKMIDRGAWVNRPSLCYAIKNQNIEAINLFIARKRISYRFEDEKKILEAAYETHNKELIKIMKRYTYQCKKDWVRKNRGWWQFALFTIDNCSQQMLAGMRGWWQASTPTAANANEEEPKVVVSSKDSLRLSSTDVSDAGTLQEKKIL